MGRAVAVGLLLLIAAAACAQRVNNYDLYKRKYFPVLRNDQWGYIDSTGKIVLQPQYESAGDFINDRAVVKAGGSYGVVDASFDTLLPFKFDSIINNERLLLVCEKGQWYFYGYGGKLLHATAYRAIRELNEKNRAPLYKVWSGNKCGLLDSTLAVVLPVKYDRFTRYTRNRFLVNSSGMFGICDKKGKEIVPVQYDEITSFNDSIMQVRAGDKWGYIVESTGRVITPPRWHDIKILDAHYFKAWVDTNAVLCSIATGKVVSSGYEDYFPLSENFIAVRSKGKIGVITKSNKIQVKPLYEDVTALSPRFFAVADKGKYGVITYKGDTVVPMQYTGVKALETADQNAARTQVYFKVYNMSEAGVCDTTGKIVVPARFLDVMVYDDKTFRTEISGRYGLYNKKGVELFEPKYDVINKEENVYIAHVGLCHAVSTVEAVVGMPLYDKVVVGNNAVKLYNGGFLDVVTLTSAGTVEERFTYDKIPSYNVLSFIPPPTQRNSPFESEKYEWVLWQVTGKWGVREKATGKFVIAPQYDDVLPTDYGNAHSITVVRKDTVLELDGFRLTVKRLYGMVDLNEAKEYHTPSYVFIGTRKNSERSVYSNMEPMLHISGKFNFLAGYEENSQGRVSYIDRVYRNTLRYSSGGSLDLAADAPGEPVDDLHSFYRRLTEYAPLSAAGKASLDMLMSDSLRLFATGTWSYIQTYTESNTNILKYRSLGNLQYAEAPGPRFAIVYNDGGKPGLLDMTALSPNWLDYVSLSPTGPHFNYYMAGVNDSVCGFIDSLGRVKLRTIYDDVRDFSEGLAAVKTNGKWTYIDTKGGRIMDASLEYAGDFKKGIAYVKKDGYYGLIDKKGNFILPAQYDELGQFHDGLACAKSRNKYYYVRPDGSPLKTPVLKKATDFAYGYAVVKTAGGFGIIDADGNFVLDKQAGIGSIGTSLVVPVKGKKGFALYDIASKKMVTKFRYKKMGRESDGLIPVKTNNKTGYIDVTGKSVVEEVYDQAEDFQQGRARVRLKRKWGYIDPSGNFVTEVRYDELSAFTDGVAIAMINDTSYCIDRDGKLLFAIDSFAIVSPFSNGIAIAKRNGKFYYIDKSGKNFMNRYFDAAKPFVDGYAEVMMNGYCRVIDMKGEHAAGKRYVSVGRLNNGLSAVTLGTLYGIINSKDEIIVPAEYERVMPVHPDIFRVEKDDLTGYVRKGGKVIWELQK
jgi:hypothetical protein